MNILQKSLIIGSLAITPGAFAQIYVADFSSTVGYDHTTSTPPPAAPSSLDGGNWTIGYDVLPATDSSSNIFGSNGTSLVSDDFGGAAYFITDTIDVSSLTSVDIFGVGATSGSGVFNNTPTEFFQWSYILDGGTPVTGPTITSDGSLNQSWTGVDVSGANSLVVRFDFNINGGSDGFEITSVSAVPEPSTYAAVLGALGLALVVYRRRK